MENFIKNRLKYWYIPLILGILFIVLGIRTFAAPIGTLLTLAVLFSIGFIITGVLEIIYSTSNRKDLKNWGWYLTGGILSTLIGIHLLIRPELTALLLSFYIGFWVLFRSISQISTSIELKNDGEKNWGWVLTFGILGILFSLVLLWNPLITGLAVSFWIGLAFITVGLLHIILSFSLYKS